MLKIIKGILLASLFVGTAYAASTNITTYTPSGTSPTTGQIPMRQSTGTDGAEVPSHLTDDGSLVHTTEPFDLGTGNYATYQVANDTTTGTTQNKLAKYTSTGKAIITTAGDNYVAIGVVTSAGATTGNATIAIGGDVSCVSDNTTVVGHFATISASVNGDCTDSGTAAGSTPPTKQVLGIWVTAGTGTQTLHLFMQGIAAAGGFTPIRTIFTSSGTWTENASTTTVEVWGCGGGGAGGSGVSAAADGGGGGGGGGYCGSGLGGYIAPMTAAEAGSSQTITIGSGGTHGAAGANGGDGTASCFGGSTCTTTVSSGNLAYFGGGGGGKAATGAGGGSAGRGGSPISSATTTTVGTGGGNVDANGGTGGTNGSGGGTGASMILFGGSGGGAGGAGGGSTLSGGVGAGSANFCAGGTAGTGVTTGSASQAGSATIAYNEGPGCGGGGGGSATTGVAGAGGNGSVNGGGGGGGGTASTAGGTGGVGGNGGRGIIVVVER